jgi:Flp pilus assembly protein TadD
MPSDTRVFDVDAAFNELDGPEVPTLQSSLERGAIRASAEGRHERALSLYQQLIDANPSELKYQFGLAETLRRLGEYKAALFIYEDITDKNPKHFEALEGMALSKMGMGDTEESARILQRVLKMDRSRWRTLNALGILFAVKDMPDESTAYLKEALRVSPNNASVMNNLGLIHAMQKEYEVAVQTLKDAARFGKDERQRKQIDMNRALIHGISGQADEAERIAAQYLDGGALQNNLGLYAYLSDNGELAKSYLNMALTGEQTHYKRAWKNLDIIEGEGEQNKKTKKNGKRVKTN